METVKLAYDEYETSQTDHSKCPILLLHGLFWNKYMYRELAEDLCSATRRRVYCVDLRNHDTSPSREDCDTMLMAEDLKRFVKDRGVEKVAIVAHSFSSTIAYQIILDQPEMVEKTVMIDHPPFPHYTEEFFQAMVVPQHTQQKRVLESLDPSLTLPAAKRKIMNLYSAAPTEGQKIFLMKMAYELVKENGRFKWRTNHDDLLERYHKGLFRPHWRGSSDHEILIVRAEGSPRMSDKKWAAVKHYNPNAKLMTVPGTTHLLMFEKRDEFVGACQDFLA